MTLAERRQGKEFGSGADGDAMMLGPDSSGPITKTASTGPDGGMADGADSKYGSERSAEFDPLLGTTRTANTFLP